MKIFITKNTCPATFIYKVLHFAIERGICKKEMLFYVNSAYNHYSKKERRK